MLDTCFYAYILLEDISACHLCAYYGRHMSLVFITPTFLSVVLLMNMKTEYS